MLPLEAEPVVRGTKDSNIEGINEFYDALVEEPVSNGGVLLNGFVAS